MSTIYKRGDGYLYYCYTRNNRRKYVSLGKATKRLQRNKNQIKANLDKKYENEDYLEYWDKIKISTFTKDFAAKKNKRSTKEYYLYCADKLIEKAGDLYIDEINNFDLDLIKKDTNLAVNSKHTILRGLRAILNEAARLGLRKKIRIENIREKKIEREVITEKEIEILLDDVKSERHKLVINFMLRSGFRLNEMIKLKWEDIKWEKGIIYLQDTKSKQRDHFPLLDEIKELLWPIAKESGSIFQYKNEESVSYLRKILRKHKMNFQDFRRYFATKWAKELEPAELMLLMRHASIKTTMNYYVYLRLEDVNRKMKMKNREKIVAEL